ncbi:MAG: leucine-rich repeat domain-containing protein [Verrucomicrobiales bacterium]|nr:leucine-rich repeat domain-containing protein [Verrucomicrobiales bacterium]
MKRTGLSILLLLCITAPAVNATTVNMDSASNYAGGWTDGSNGGGGFKAWSIEANAGSGTVDYGIWDSPDADLQMGEAFGFTALGTDASIRLSRDFTTALAAGDVFKLDLGINYDAGETGSKGFVLYTADDREIVVVNQGNSMNITMNGTAVLTNYGTATMYWTFTQNSATEITVYATGRGGESEKYTGSLVLSQASYIAGIRFYGNGITNDAYADYRAVYFNNLTLSQGASGDATFGYATKDGQVTITDIAEDASGALIIPSALGGSPVTEIARTAGAYCTNITSLSFVNGAAVTNIGVNAFQGCTSLRSAVLPAGLTAIPDGLFYGCTDLGSVTIPPGVVSIGNSAFANCRALVSAELPEGLASLGRSVFLNCRSLASLHIPGTITNIPGQLCYECRSLGELTLPDNAAHIGYRAFYDCQSMESLHVPSSVTAIDDGAFEGCSSLISLVFGGTLTRVGDEAFYGCDALASLYFNGGVNVLSDAVFGQDERLTALYFKCDVPTLDTGADLFIGSNNVTVYYIANPSSWGLTFAGAPVVVWAPRIVDMTRAEDDVLITAEWGGEGTITLQVCTNLVEGNWIDVDTNALSNGSCVLLDPDGYLGNQRYYRVFLH